MHHRLLNRQLKRHFGKEYDFESLDPKMQELFKNIEKSYLAYEKEKALIENILKVNSDELYETNKELKNINQTLEDRVQEEVEKNRIRDEHLVQQSRLAQMGEMISMIAHQWRQPLTAISTIAGHLKLNLILDDIDSKKFEANVDLISDYSQHLSRTIDDFRGFFKENKEKETTNLNEIVNSTIDIVKVSIESKDIMIQTDLNSDQTIKTYPNEIKQVVLNLIKNAEDILLEKKIKDPTITIKTLSDKTKQILIVKDNAGGVPKDIKNKIFEPYFSTKLEKDGTGLGLYMSKTIIEEHCSGKLSADNDKNGAVFTIELDTKL